MDFIISIFLKILGDGSQICATLQKFIVLLEEMTANTATVIDDISVRLAKVAIEDDEIWDIVWSAIESLLNQDSGAAPASADDPQIVAAAKVLGDKTGIDPITIIALIMQLIEMFREWRNR